MYGAPRIHFLFASGCPGGKGGFFNRAKQQIVMPKTGYSAQQYEATPFRRTECSLKQGLFYNRMIKEYLSLFLRTDGSLEQSVSQKHSVI